MKANEPALPARTEVGLGAKEAHRHATKFIPVWVKVAVALALGLGTMIGWKRIVMTVGEKIGKKHLTYAQGAAAELVAMATILAADQYRAAGKHHAYFAFGGGRDDGGERSGLQIWNAAQYCAGLGVYAAGRGTAIGEPVLAIPTTRLKRIASRLDARSFVPDTAQFVLLLESIMPFIVVGYHVESGLPVPRVPGHIFHSSFGVS